MINSEDFDFESRIVTTSYQSEDSDVEASLRPKSLTDYICQDRAKENLKIYIEAAKLRGESLDHVLLYGPPGLGKTTLSNIIANEMGVNIRVTSGPAIEKQGDLAALLTNLQEGDVLFIDEIHRLSRSIEEILYPAMEDNALDIIIGKGPSARSIRIDLPRFTLIGATTRAGQLTTPLRDRFGVLLKLELYTPDELQTIVTRSAGILGFDITPDPHRDGNSTLKWWSEEGKVDRVKYNATDFLRQPPVTKITAFTYEVEVLLFKSLDEGKIFNIELYSNGNTAVSVPVSVKGGEMFFTPSDTAPVRLGSTDGWVKLKLEYYPIDDSSAKTKLFADGVCVAESASFAGDKPLDFVDGAAFAAEEAYLEFLFDNLKCRICTDKTYS